MAVFLLAFDWGVIFHNHPNTVYKFNISGNVPNEADKTKEPSFNIIRLYVVKSEYNI